MRPFVGDSDYAILKNVLEGVVAPPRSHNPEIPEALEQVVLKALAKNVDERFPRASELAEGLKPFSSDRAALARFMTATFPDDEVRDLTEPEEKPAPDDGLASVIAQLERKWGV